MEMNLIPIGLVKNNITEPKRESWESVISEIIINEDSKEARSRIEEFSHIIVICWMHKVSQSQRSIMQVHPKGDRSLPLVGALASRSPARPNPIGITTVKLLDRRDNVLKVIGLDAIDGTPVLDIKPYIPGNDSPTEAKTPGWITT